jgi:ammonium transporter, Amt family
MNGLLTGLAAITAGCATVDTYGAVIIGIVAGWVYLGISKLLVALKIDDVVDAIPVHLGGGVWGVLATGLLSKPELLEAAFGEGQGDNAGWFYEWGRGSGNFSLMLNQLAEAGFVFGWTFVTMYTFYFGLNMLGWLRVEYVEEEAGIDISRHKGACYDMTSGAATEDAIMELQTSRHKYLDDRSGSRGSVKKGGDDAKQAADSDDKPSDADAQSEA